MEKLFKENNIEVSCEQLDSFNKYCELLIYYNNMFNITAITEREDIYKKHFIDSLLFVDKLKGGYYLDVGSGGGFPALPVAIMRKDINYTLLEATGKKCEFLKTVVKELKLNNVKVINGRAEDLGKDIIYREKFDCVTARAVARLNTLCEYCMPFVKLGGEFLAYKGEAEEEVKEALNAINVLGGKLKEVYNSDLYEAKRSLIVIEKISKTDKKYPRGNGKERKNPL